MHRRTALAGRGRRRERWGARREWGGGLEPLEPRLLMVATAIGDAYALSQQSVLLADGLSGRPAGVLSNDTDALFAVLDSPPSNGSVSLNADGTFTYISQPNFIGQDSFTYRAAGSPQSQTILNNSTVWTYLHPTNGVNPANSDPDFNTTWYTNTNYNGPAFNRSGTGMFGYGSIDFAPINTNIGQPPSGSRYTAYFKTTFQFSGQVQNVISLTATALVDDGALIYINGQLAANMNMPVGAPDTYTSFASSFNNELGNSESNPLTRTIDPSLLVPGTNVIGVSVHNNDPTSSDMGFQFTLTAQIAQSSAPATVTLDVSDASRPPVVIDDLYEPVEDQVFDTRLLDGGAGRSVFANDGLLGAMGVAFDEITDVQIDASGAVGVVAFDPATGHFTYAPPEDFQGLTQFTYTVRDKDGVSNSAIVLLNVDGVNDPPSAVADHYVVDLREGLNTRRQTAATALIEAGGPSFQPLGNHVWRYLDDGSDQGTAWRNPLFDDSTWASGVGELGYGDDDERTIVGFIDTNPVQNGVQINATTYFRSTFNVDDPAAFAELLLNINFDDGVAVYINGVEVVRDNLVPGALFNQFALANMNNEGSFQSYTVANTAGLLRPGQNVIAAEIHQNNATSSDISFDLSLAGVRVVSDTGVLANDDDPDHDRLRAILVTGPQFHDTSAGPFVLNQDGTFTYRPLPGGGADSFTYNLSDGTVTIGPITVTLEPDYLAFEPRGGLIYAAPPVRDEIETADQLKSFDYMLESGQTLAAIVVPIMSQLHASAELLDPMGQVIASGVAAAPGQPLVLQPTAVELPGVYTLRITGAGQTTGAFGANALLNAAIEDELFTQIPNDAQELAMDIDESFITLDGAAAQRGAVLGSASNAEEDWYSFTIGDGAAASIVLAAEGPAAATIELYDAAGQLLAAGSEAGNAGQIIAGFRDMTTDGQPTPYWVRVATTGLAEYTLLVTRGAQFEVEPNDVSAAALDITRSGRALGALGGGTSAAGNGEPGTPVTLPVILTDGQGFLWDVSNDGTIDNGTIDAYDGGLRHQNVNFFTDGLIEDGGREVVVGPQVLGNIRITRKVYVPDDNGFARYLEIVTNTGASAFNYNMLITTNLGSDSGTVLVSTSSGDTAFTNEDNWLVTDDIDGSGDPTVTHVIAGEDGRLKPVNANAAQGSDSVSFSYALSLAPGETQVVMHFAVQTNTRAEAIAKAEQLSRLELDALRGMSAEELANLVNFATLDLGDFYAVQVNEGDMLAIATRTPGDGAGKFDNLLDPVIELFNPAGERVAMDDNSGADGRNAMLSQIAAAAGTWTVRVSGAAGTQGEYVLSIDGHTGTDAIPQVASITPADGQVVQTFPATITVQFTEALNPDTVDAADLLINGLASATSVEVIDGRTLVFSIDPATNVGESVYDLAVPANAVFDLQDNGNPRFDSSFVFDGTGPRIVALSVNGQTLPMTAVIDGTSLTIEAVFDQPLVVDLGLDDVRLSGPNNFNIPPSVFGYDQTTGTLTLRFDGLVEGNHSLRLFSDATSFRDLNGIPLDGEAIGHGPGGLPTGDGVPGGDYFLSLIMEQGDVNVDGQWTRVEPLGSLALVNDIDGRMNYLGDIDGYRFDLDAGERIEVRINADRPALFYTLEVFDPMGQVIAAATTDQPVLTLSAATHAATGGTYRVAVSGTAVNSNYQLRVLRNAVSEGTDTSDASPGDAGPVNGSFGVDRYAIVGQSTAQSAESVAWGAQPATGRIIRFEPTRGTVLGQFNAPDALMPNHTQIGLSLAEGGDVLLYLNAHNDPTALYRLHPQTGVVLSIERIATGNYDGLAFESVPAVETVLNERFESVPTGWTLTGDWEQGYASGAFTPPSAGSGFGLLGTNVDGTFTPGRPTPSYAVTPVMDLRGYSEVTLSYSRWLRPGVEPTFVEVTNDGVNWVEVVRTQNHYDFNWTRLTHDISATAANQMMVQVRFGLGPTSTDGFADSGFSLDDVTITGRQSPAQFLFLGNDGDNLRRQTGYAGQQVGDWAAGSPTGAVGGDDAGRVFALFDDGLIHEVDRRFDTDDYLNGFAPPAANVEGLAYDGLNLYASTAGGTVYTLDPNTGRIVSSSVIEGGGLFGLAAASLTALRGGVVDEIEPNSTIAAAQSIDGQFSLQFSENIGDQLTNTSTTIPHVTVRGTGDDTYDVYSFTVSSVPARGIFDIDAANAAGFLDGYLRLYRADGVLLASNDDAQTTFGAGGSNSSLDSYIENVFTEPGVYYIEVGSCCVSPVGQGATYELQVSIENYGSTSAAPVTFIPAGSQWRYLDNGSNQGLAWRQPGFNDAAWSTGTAQFGYGNDGEVTTVGFGGDPNNKHVTTYFRTTFQVSDPTRVRNLLLEILRDDGAAVYLNGVEIVRSNLAPGAGYQTQADSVIYEQQGPPDETEGNFLPFAISPSLLVAGTNILAVEIHQFGLDSSDLAFDLSLRGTVGDAIVPDIDAYELDLTGYEGRAIDVALAGHDGVSFRGGTLELIAPDGQTVVATGSASPLGQTVSNFDLGIADFIVPAGGVYTVRIASTSTGSYTLLVPVGAMFDTEPNENPGVDVFRTLSNERGRVVGLIGDDGPLDDEADAYRLVLEAGRAVEGMVRFPYVGLPPELGSTGFAGVVAVDPNFNPVLEMIAPISQGMIEFSFVAQMSGEYLMAVVADDGTVQYILDVEIDPLLQVSAVTPADGEALVTSPMQIRFDFDRAIQPSSVDLTDLLIDGMTAATGFTILPGDTSVVFNVTLNLVAGAHSIALLGSSILGGNDEPLAAFASTFTILGAPIVANLAPSNIGSRAATIGGRILDTGGQDPTLLLYYGDNDGHTDPAAWDHVLHLGELPTGVFTQTIAGLNPQTTYYFRAFASNAAGANWADATASFSTLDSEPPVINELLADNRTIITDIDGDYSDYIEIANRDIAPLNLSGWYLTDDPNNLTRWRVPDGVVIPGDGYLLIFASNKNRTDPAGELHTNFRLSDDGEFTALVAPDGVTIVHAFTPAFPEQDPDESYGLIPNTRDAAYFIVPTPGAMNIVGDPTRQIVINEIMYNPPSGSDAHEWIELHNHGPVSINVAGWRFSNGVDFTLPDVTIAAGGYLVVAADVAAFLANPLNAGFGGAVVGGWTGSLRDSGETLEISHADGDRVDRVQYSDQGDWGTRVRGPLDRGYRGWVWSAAHDGGGRSLSLINVNLSNNHGTNWTSSGATGGTPGQPNDVRSSNIAPLIFDVEHSPAVPMPNQPVTIRADVRDEATDGTGVFVHYRLDGAPSFTVLPMFDDGLHGDGEAGDGRWGATLPGQPDEAIVEFYVSARDAQNQTRTYPAPARNESGVSQQVANLLYQVDAEAASGDQPFYRIIMTEAERAELEALGNTQASRDSNAQMNATFISSDGREVQVRYNTGVRIRGAGSRGIDPKSYRVNFPHDGEWKGVTEINLKSQFTYMQVLGGAISRLAGLPAADAYPVQLRLNGVNLASAGGNQLGSYVHVESINGDFLDQHLPADPDGNLYEARRPNTDLSYLGVNPQSYINTGYTKETNENENDWNDLIDLTYMLNNLDGLDDAAYLDAVAQRVDIDNWVLYFAVNALLSNGETGLGTGVGDDYSMYRGAIDSRFTLIIHDLDSILGQGQSASVGESIFRAAALASVEQFLTHPAIIRRYYQTLWNLTETTFAPAHVNPVIDHLLGDWVPQQRIDQIKAFIVERNAAVRAQIPTELTIGHNLSLQGGLPRSTTGGVGLTGSANVLGTAQVLLNGASADWNAELGRWSTPLGDSVTLVPQGSVWRYLDNGTNQGTAWRQPGFNDAGWASGPAQLGYGDGDEATVVAFIDADPNQGGTQRNATTYFRHTFNITDANQLAGLQLRLLRDDGAAVYLNGVEIARDNLPGGATFQTYTGQAVPGGDEDRFFDFFVPITPGLIVEGANVLAVEVHQSDPTSSDISFDLSLSGVRFADGVMLNPGINHLLVQSLDEQGDELERGRLTVWYDTGAVSTLPNTVVNAGQTLRLDLAGAPYLINGTLTIQPGATMLIDPGVTVYFGSGATIDVRGQLIAEGTDTELIHLGIQPGLSHGWAGIRFADTSADNRLTHTYMTGASAGGEWLRVDHSDLLIDHVTFTDAGNTIVHGIESSITIRHAMFGTVLGVNAVTIEGIDPAGAFVVESSAFSRTPLAGDAIDVTATAVNQPMIRISDSTFAGGGANGVDLHGIDAYLEGNRFNGYNNASGHAVSMDGAGNDSALYLVRGFFDGNAHGVRVADGAGLIAQNNTFVNHTLAAVRLGDPSLSPPMLAQIDSTVFFDNALTFDALPAGVPVMVDHSILPASLHGLGEGNLDADPRLDEDGGLMPGSAAIGAGDNGIDIGAAVKQGATISGEPIGVTSQPFALLRVAGPGIVSYQYRLNGGPWMPEAPVAAPIMLMNLPEGAYTVEVTGRNVAGVLRSEADPAVSRTWTVSAAATTVRLSEVLAANASIAWNGGIGDLIELHNDGLMPVDLGGMSISDNPDVPNKFTFAPGTIIEPFGYLVLIADGSIEPGHVPFSLNGDGEGVYLFDAVSRGGAMLDGVRFGFQLTDRSIGRDSHGVWRLNDPTFGDANVAAPTGDIFSMQINEYLASGLHLLTDDFIELHNTDDVAVDLGGALLTDNVVGGAHAFRIAGPTGPGLHAFAPLSFIAPRGFVVMTADGLPEEGPHHLPFQLAAEQEAIGLFTADARPIDAMIYTNQLDDVSEGRRTEGDSAIVALTEPTPGAPNRFDAPTVVTLIDFEDPVRYDQRNIDLGTAWRAPDYDDDAWPQGAGPLGFDDAVLPLPLRTPLIPGDGRITYYFRRSFFYNDEIGRPEDVSIILDTLIDDGAVFYLNGQEVLRIRIPDGPVDHSTQVTFGVGNASIERFVIPGNLLVPGLNTWAVEVHQTDANSSDVAFGMQMQISAPPPPTNTQLLRDHLRVTEVSAEPAGGSAYEFIELTNTGSEAMDLTGVRISAGVDFTFGPFTLEGGVSVVVVADLAAFEARYGQGPLVAGQYTGSLNNAGENIAIQLPDPFTGYIQQFEYDGDWYPGQTEQGASIQVVDPTADLAQWSVKAHWRPSAVAPSPGVIDDPVDFNGDGVIDHHDIDAVYDAVTDGEDHPAYDLNADGDVNMDDARYLVEEVLGTRFGDINLDGRVGMTDFGLLAAYFGATDVMGWANGDLNGDRRVTIRDLAILATYYGMTEMLSQWASSVIAFSTEYTDTSWAAAQALGEPDTFTYGDLSTAWAPEPINGTAEFITVGFDTPVYATGVTIRETYGNGFVTRIELRDEAGVFHTVWQDVDPSLPGAPADFRVNFPQTAYRADAVRITTNTDHDLGAWEEIDAIALHGVTASGAGGGRGSVAGASAERGGSGEVNLLEPDYDAAHTPVATPPPAAPAAPTRLSPSGWAHIGSILSTTNDVDLLAEA